jgi:hypothetical protein
VTAWGGLPTGHIVREEIDKHSVDFGSNGLACGLGDRLGDEGEYGGDSGLKERSGVERMVHDKVLLK